MSKFQRAISILDFISKEQGLTKISLSKYVDVLSHAQQTYWGELRDQYQKTQQISDDIRPWVEISSETTTDSNGQYTLPSNYGTYTGLYFGDDETEIPVISEAKWGARVSSKIMPPSATEPISVFRGSYIQFSPKQAYSGVMMVYIKQPSDVEISRSTGGNRESLTAVNVDLEATENGVDEIIRRAALVLFPALNDEAIGGYFQQAMALEQKQGR